MRRAKMVMAALLLTGSAGAWAASCEIPAGPASAAQLAACRTELADSEADLAKAYRRLRTQTPMELRTALGKTQQAWEAYRAAQCLFEGGGRPGAVNVPTLACLSGMNRDRIGRLEDRLLLGE